MFDWLWSTAPDIVSSTVEKHGFKCETHADIQTEDGHLLTLHRVLPSERFSGAKKGPILLVHGMLGCSGHFLLVGADKSLPYKLATSGYDVWLANMRGTDYSRHSSLAKTDPAYWDFSMHHMGLYDLPAIIDYILDCTKEKQLFYVGYSQGVVVFFIMCSLREQYAKAVRLFCALSPMIFVADSPHPWLPLACYFEKQYQFLTRLVGRTFVQLGLLGRIQTVLTCSALTKAIVKLVIRVLIGTDTKKINDETLKTLLQFVQGVNLPCLYQAMQMHNNARFAQYDYYEGKQNRKYYGSEMVVDYDLSKATMPIALYYSQTDWFLASNNVHQLASKLQNVVEVYSIPSPHFSHLDFLVCPDVDEVLYKPLISTLDSF